MAKHANGMQSTDNVRVSGLAVGTFTVITLGKDNNCRNKATQEQAKAIHSQIAVTEGPAPALPLAET